MATAEARYRCLACNKVIALTPDRRCEFCGVSYDSRAAAAVVQADRSLAELAARSEELKNLTLQWQAHREATVAALKMTAPRDWPGPQAADAEPDLPQEPMPVAAPVPVEPVPAPVAAPVPAEPVPAPVPAPGDPYAPGSQSRFERPRKAASAAMTAPALLGVSGSSLLIAASIVFVALAWTAFPPITRGLIVSGVAVLVSAIAMWLKKLGLTVSSGAVGFVAMGFAGTATLAFSRGTGALGGYDIPTALLVACAAGLLLARLGIQWVGSAAALALGGAAVGYTVVATRGASASADPGATASAIRGIWVWVIVGTVTASVLAATYAFWKSRVARIAVKWVSVVWLSLVGASASLWVWARDGIPVDAAFTVLPIVALAVLARRWPALAVGPAAFLVTLIAPALVSTWEPGLWQQATAIAIAVAALLALGPWAPTSVRLPLLLGVSPGYVTVAVAAATYSVTITVVRIIAGTYVPDTQLWAGVAALVAGLSIAQLRLWKLDSPWVKVASGVGAIMVITGLGIVAFGLAEAWNRDYHSSVAVAMTVGAVVLLFVMRLWAYRQAAFLTGLGAWAFLLVAAGHSAWAVAVTEIPLAFALIVALAPIALLVVRGRTHPWWGMVPAALFLTLVASAVLGRYDASAEWIVTGAVGMAAAVLWAGRAVPRSWAQPVAIGLTPALVVGLTASVFTAVDTVWRVTGGGDSGLSLMWIAPALVTAIALGGFARWPMPQALLNATGVAGATSVLVVAVAAAFDGAHLWGAEVPGAVSGFGVVASLAAVAFTALWRSRTASWVNGVGAAALLTICGINAAANVANSRVPLAMPLAFACAAIAVLAIFGRWWPAVSLGPASFLATGLVLAVVSREAGGAAAIATATAVAALILWGSLRLGRTSRLALGFGLSPFAGVVGMVILAIAGAAFAQVLTWGTADVGQLGSWWAVLVAIAAIFGVEALVRAPSSSRGAPGLKVLLAVLATVAVAALTVVVGSTVRGLAQQADSQWYWVTAATGVGVALTAALIRLASTLADAWVGSEPARRVLRGGAVVWLTTLGLSAAWATRADTVLGVVGAVATALVVTVLVLVARRRPVLAAASAALVGTFAVFMACQARFPYSVAAFASTAVVAGLVWLVRKRGAKARLATAVGLAPAGVVAVVEVVRAAMDTLFAYVAAWQDYSWEHVLSSPWSYGAVGLVALALLVIAKVRAHWGTLVLAVAALVVAMLPSVAAAWVLAALALAAVVVGRRARTRDGIATGAGVLALGWAVPSMLTVAGVMAVLAIIGIIVGRRSSESAWPWGGVLATVASSSAGAALIAGLGGTAVVIAPVAMAVAAGMALALALLGVHKGAEMAPWLVSIATVVIPLAAPGFTARGMALVVAGVAWFAMAIRGDRFGRWWAASALSLGTILLVAGAGVSQIEAYTITPAVAALTLGVLWLREAPHIPSLQALWPGLSLALAPSYIALAGDPDSLPRTAALTLAIVGLAVVGVRLKWLAPILGTAITSIVVSVLQIVVGSNMVLRMISWIIVGSLLLAFASWFEKLKTLR